MMYETLSEFIYSELQENCCTMRDADGYPDYQATHELAIELAGKIHQRLITTFANELAGKAMSFPEKKTE